MIVLLYNIVLHGAFFKLQDCIRSIQKTVHFLTLRAFLAI